MRDIAKVVKVLSLYKPYSIILKSKGKKNALAKYWGMYKKGELDYHLIHIYVGNLEDDTRDLDSVIAHELIHAWQEERGIKETHGGQFQIMARKLGFLFDLENVYLEDVDL